MGLSVSSLQVVSAVPWVALGYLRNLHRVGRDDSRPLAFQISSWRQDRAPKWHQMLMYGNWIWPLLSKLKPITIPWHGRSPFFRFILQVLQRTLQFYLQRHTITDLFWIKGMGKMISQGPFLSLDWASGEWTQTLFCMTVFLTLVQLSPAHMSSLHWKLEVRKPLSFILHFNDGSTALPILSTDIPCTALRQK